MNHLFAQLIKELSTGHEAILCTITASRGSTPRGAGASMLLLSDGATAGTIGGGSAEYRAVQKAKELLSQKTSGAETYILSPQGPLGMVCGGEVDVRFQYFAPEDIEKAAALAPPDGARVCLFGGGHVAQALARVLTLADFSVEVWDERPEMVTEKLFPDAAVRRCGPYEDALDALPAVAAEDFVVVMTHGHQADFTVLSQVLRTPAKYIGCIGSKGKAAAVRDRLLAAGFTEEDVSRIHSPIGLPIGGKTPGEIAVSVAAEMIACRYGRREDLR